MQATRTCARIITPYLVHTSPQWSYVVIGCCFAELVDPAWLGGCIQCCVGKMEQNIESLLPTPLCLPSVDMSWGFSILTASRYWGKLIPCHDENIENLDFTTCFECKRCENDLWFVQYLIKSRPSGGNYYKLLRGDLHSQGLDGLCLDESCHGIKNRFISNDAVFRPGKTMLRPKAATILDRLHPSSEILKAFASSNSVTYFLGTEG